MKIKYIFIFIFCLSLNLHAQTKPTSNSNTTSSALQEAKVLIGQLNTELNNAKQSNGNLTIKLNETNSKLKDSENNIATLQKQIKSLTDWGVHQQQESFKWLEKYNNAIKRYHLLKNISAAVGALFGFILGLNLMRFVPPVYAAYAFALPLVGAILAFTGIWLFL
jgi:septal ring factor EnvC (AmiA/AmiB activator)